MILRVCVVIPVFNNTQTVSDAVKDAVLNTPFPILIVDDGSDRPVIDCLYSWDVKQAMEQGRVRLVRLPQNRGKGAALQFAIQDLVPQGFTHMVTMDADGQHSAREIHKLVAVAKEHPWDLILGHRQFRAGVQDSSKFGRKFANFWVAYQTGMEVRDSQSGFRLYPLFAIQNLSFFTRKFDFEIEVLIRLMWRGIQVRESDVYINYQPEAERVSHFHKLWDNLRISMLNAVLVLVTLVKSRRSPAQLAAGVGVGVMIGCTPFFGLHTLLVAMASFLLRLNFVALFLGSQISAPPLAPLIILASIYVGSQWLHLPLGDGAVPHLQQWLVGSLVAGLALGVLAAGITLALAHLMARRERAPTNWNGLARGGRLTHGFLLLVLRQLGLKASYFCLYLIAPYFYLFAPQGRRGLNEYYRLLRPELSWFKRQAQIFKHFLRFGQVLLDRAYQRLAADLVFDIQVDGRANFMRPVDEGRGLLMLGAQMGGWELSSEVTARTGVSREICRVDHELTGHSADGNKDAIFLIHQKLNEGKCVGIMGDHPIADRFELIPFLGKLAPFDVTAFRLAAASRAPMLYHFGFKETGRRYTFIGRPPRVYTYSDRMARELQLFAWTESYVQELESFVRRYPDQWFNFYPFWSSVPTAYDGTAKPGSGQVLLEELVAVKTDEVRPPEPSSSL